MAGRRRIEATEGHIFAGRENFMEEKARLSNHLIKPRAIAGNTEYIKNPGYPKEALGPGVSVEKHCEIGKAWRHELTIADHDLTLATALPARRACASPLRVSGRAPVRRGRAVPHDLHVE